MRAILPILAAASLLAPPSLADPTPVPGLTCIDPPFAEPAGTGSGALVDLVSRLRADLAAFPSLRDALEGSEFPVCLDERRTDARGYLDVDRGMIVVGAALAPDVQRAILFHELRHLEQYGRGFCPSNALAMAENARAVFAMEADAQAITALVAWSIKDSAGESGPWEAILGWPNYADIAERFEAEMTSTNDPAQAVSAAFDQWFESEARVVSYYLTSCSDYLDRQDSTKRLPRYELLPPDFYTSLCRMPDGRAYDCGAPPIGAE